MEENIDSIKENSSNEEKALNNVPTENNESKKNEEEALKNIPIESNEKDQSSLINQNTSENAVNTNNQNYSVCLIKV